MIEIKDGFLWKMYRYYHFDSTKDTRQPPHPKSLCPFMRQALGGFIKYSLFGDSFLLFFGLWAIIECSFLSAHFLSDSSVLKEMMGGFVVVGGALGILITIIRYFKWCDDTGRERLSFVSLCLLIYCFIGFVVSMGFAPKDHYHWIHLVYGFLATGGGILAAALLVVGYFFLFVSSDTNNIVREYAKVIHHRMCPMVRVPNEDQYNKESE